MIFPHFNRIIGREKSTNNYITVTQTAVKQLKQGYRMDYRQSRPIFPCVNGHKLPSATLHLSR
jgi:hypothetical protein